jgi:hypothetical protein
MASRVISKYKNKIQAKERNAMDCDEGAEGFPHSVYCCISLQPPVENINHPKAFVGS